MEKTCARKPFGGFILLTVQQLALLWWAYTERLIQLFDLRVWYAAHEMAARRCQLTPGHTPLYTLPELHGLVGGRGGEYLRASLRRLEAVGLLAWSDTRLRFATGLSDLHTHHDLTTLHAMLARIPNHRRRVPMPRQVVRLIAKGRRPAVIATILGHLCRCLYYHHQQCHSGGLCKASWIAEVFGVHPRNVKAARKHLVALGWLHLYPTPQRVLNRFGLRTAINLAWHRTTGDDDTATTPPTSSPASAPPRPPTSPSLQGIDATYHALPADRKHALHEAAITRLVAQGYHRDFLITPLILHEIGTLLALETVAVPVIPPQSPPHPACSTTPLPLPLLYTKPFQESNNQKPGFARPAGLQKATKEKTPALHHTPSSHPNHPQHPTRSLQKNYVTRGKSITQQQPYTPPTIAKPTGERQGSTTDRPSRALPPPRLRHIRLEDLHDMHRLLTLFDEACAKQLMRGSDSDRLTFVATAEHAHVIGTTNPPGLFAHLIHRKLWHHVTQEDEDTARRRLRDHLYGAIPRLKPPLPLPPRPALSPDARLVSRLGERLLERRCQGDLFAAAHADLPGWTRERWDRAFDELERATTSASPPLPAPPVPPLLSTDARTVQLLRQDLTRAGFRGEIFPVLHHEYPDWSRERWDIACAELEAAHSMPHPAGARR